MQIVWIPQDIYNHPGRFGAASMPGSLDHSIEQDLSTLQSAHVSHLVSLVEEHEFRRLEPPESPHHRSAVVRACNIEYLHQPIQDLGAQTDEQAQQLTAFTVQAMRGGGKVLFHCGAGLGRAGTLAACTLVSLGMSPTDAITTVRWVRPGAIQSTAQERLILDFVPM